MKERCTNFPDCLGDGIACNPECSHFADALKAKEQEARQLAMEFEREADA